jgi:membrane-bound serine protease (ClpP class)
MLAFACAQRARDPALLRALLLVFALQAVCSASIAGTGPSHTNRARGDERRVAHRVKIATPIENVDRIRQVARRFVDMARQQHQWPILVFEIDNGRSEFGQALDLARFLSGSELDGATTVAYLPHGATGHTVLVAIACDEIAMPANVEIGQAGIYEQSIGAEMRSVYNEVAQRRRTIPPDVVLGMLDPALEVLQVETEVSREFVLRDRLPELAKKHAVQASRVLIRQGEAGRFTGREAKELGFVSYLADDCAALARAWGLPATALQDDLSASTDWTPVQLTIQGPIDPGLVQQTQRMLDKRAPSGGVSFVVLYLESSGGSPEDAVQLANYLARLNKDRYRTVAYIPREALADAAFLALACDQIVMHRDARLGGQWSREVPPQEVATLAGSLVEIARLKGHSTALAAALVDPRAEVFRYRHKTDGLVDYLTPAQAQALPNRDQWEREQLISSPDSHLQLRGQQAATLGLATVVHDFAELKALYGLENDPRLIEPTWVDRIVSVLNSEGAGWVLLVLAAIGLYVEAQSPGLGIGGFLAGLCFLLFFWSHYLGGTADWLEILLFAAGSLAILMEIFVLPGVGAFAFGGGALILISILLASQTFVLPHDQYQAAQMLRSLVVFSGIFVGFIVAALLLRRVLPQTPGLGQMVLAPPTREEQEQLSRREALAVYDHLLGARGTTVTPLTPAGKARFATELVDVLAEGEFLAPGTPVQVVEVRAHRVVVRLDPRAGSVG